MPNVIDKNKKYKISVTNFETGEHHSLIAKGGDIFVGHDPFNAVARGNEMADYLGVVAELNALAKKMYEISYKSDIEMLRPYALLLEEIGTILYREIC